MLNADIANAGLILVDCAMAGGAHRYLNNEPVFPAWAVPLYRGGAAAFGPLVIDIEQARQDGCLTQVEALVQAMRPALHVSLIQTRLSCKELAAHLRHFIFVNTASGDQLTLRLANCEVLPALLTALSDLQRSALCQPLSRWRIHQRDGRPARPVAAARDGRGRLQ